MAPALLIGHSLGGAAVLATKRLAVSLVVAVYSLLFFKLAAAVEIVSYLDHRNPHPYSPQ
jgi:hypothetical protein